MGRSSSTVIGHGMVGDEYEGRVTGERGNDDAVTDCTVIGHEVTEDAYEGRVMGERSMGLML